jgi:hypothetical protein
VKKTWLLKFIEFFNSWATGPVKSRSIVVYYFAYSYLRFSKCDVDEIPPFDSVKKYQQFQTIVLVKDKHYSDLWPLKGQEISYFSKLHICSKNVNNVSLKPYLSHRTQLRTYLFRCSLVRFTIKNTIYSVIFKLVGSVFHLLFRYFNLLRYYK